MLACVRALLNKKDDAIKIIDSFPLNLIEKKARVIESIITSINNLCANKAKGLNSLVLNEEELGEHANCHEFLVSLERRTSSYPDPLTINDKE
ncbi:MAG: hypothetical protein IT292_09960 [Deltaproteobacteria bacterium]|nr:hypothetical protein [Deltaproteobacteria bacterium]